MQASVSIRECAGEATLRRVRPQGAADVGGEVTTPHEMSCGRPPVWRGPCNVCRLFERMHLVTTSTSVASVPADRVSASEKAISLSAGELCERYASRVYQFASMVAGSDLEAEDLAQSALERALRGLPRFDSRKGQVEAWLWRIVVNVARDAGRAAVRRQRLWERLVQHRSGVTGNDDIPVGISNGRLLEAIRALTPHQRSDRFKE